jgi:NAD(P)-dependent dehydrogenase (short-subunit alcohol dehydrogenase family)
METNNKVWFVTGASKGMGLALVKLLLNTGHQVAATSRKVKEFEKHVDRANKNFLPLEVDITSDQSVKDALKKTVEMFGRLDVLVNNAGYAIYGSLEELSELEFRQSAEVNLFGMVNTIRNAMPYLRKQRSGHIINFSSSGGYRGFGSAGAYAAVKFAVIGLSESLAEEVKPLGVKVTVVAPGFFRTSFLDKGKLMLAKNRIADYNTSAMEAWMHEMDGKQPGDPEKLVRLLVDITRETNPPLHLIAGPDAYQLVSEKAKEDAAELVAWKSLTFSTNLEN